MTKLDDTDKKLLELLQENSKFTTKELAAKVNLSATPVFERIKHLEQNGYIEKYTAILNPEKIHNGFSVYCNIRLKKLQSAIMCRAIMILCLKFMRKT